VPEKATGGYLEGLIDSTEGEKVTVTILTTKEVSYGESYQQKVHFLFASRANSIGNCSKVPSTQILRKGKVLTFDPIFLNFFSSFYN
jgi:hypothetical protein